MGQEIHGPKGLISVDSGWRCCSSMGACQRYLGNAQSASKVVWYVSNVRAKVSYGMTEVSLALLLYIVGGAIEDHESWCRRQELSLVNLRALMQICDL